MQQQQKKKKKKAIPRKWLQADQPTVDNWLEIVRDSRDGKANFSAKTEKLFIWSKWNMYLLE